MGSSKERPQLLPQSALFLPVLAQPLVLHQDLQHGHAVHREPSSTPQPESHSCSLTNIHDTPRSIYL